jgi:hypothetical protein
MATTFGAIGADPSVGKCERLRRELHLRFDEGRPGRAIRVAFSPTLPPGPGKRTRREDHVPSHRPQMSSDRLFLDPVARQHCPSSLHRHTQINMHSAGAPGESGHFYFALTSRMQQLPPEDCWRYTGSGRASKRKCRFDHATPYNLVVEV